jgi:lysophospholipase L1-like esterase
LSLTAERSGRILFPEVQVVFALRRLLVHLGMSVVSIIATLLLLEVGVRIGSPQDLGYWDSRSFRRNLSTWPHFVENIPYGTAKFIGVPVTINREGLRGDEISTPKPPHTTRLVAVGDSITFGYGITAEDTYAKVLEKRLNANASAVKRYEVLNGGTLGGSLGDYLHFLSQKAEKLQPDIVLIGLTLNDILVYSEEGGVSEADTQWQGQQLPVVRRFSHFLLRHSQLYMLIYSRLKSSLYDSGTLDINKVQGSNFVALSPPSVYQTQAWTSSLEMLSRIVAFCRSRGYRLVVVVFPMQMQMSAADLQFYREKYHLQLGDKTLSGDPQRRLKEFAKATGVTLVDLLPVYRAYDSKDLYLRNKMIPFDPTHPSAIGNKIAAEEIFGVIKHTE